MQEDKQETEVRETTAQVGNTTIEKQSVSTNIQVPGVVIAQRIVWFIVGLITIIIGLRFALLLLGADQTAVFTDLVYSVSGAFVAPFVGMFGQPTYGTSVFELSSVLAIVVYALIGFGITKLLTIGRSRAEV